MNVLMCPPTYFDIRYEINPWMKIARGIAPRRAKRQWNDLVSVLEKRGVNVFRVRPRAGLPDMVFTANAGVVRGREFIPSHFRFAERRGEEPAFTDYFRRHGYRIRDSARNLFFEGEGDLLRYRDTLFGGFRFRSEKRAHERVAAALKTPLVCLDLVQPHFYHLDTCFFPIDHDSALYFPEAFDAAGRRAITRVIRRPIAVSRRDAEAFACNGLRVGQDIIVNQASRRLRADLDRIGYRVVETATGEFMKAGGSVKCLILKL